MAGDEINLSVVLATNLPSCYGRANRSQTSAIATESGCCVVVEQMYNLSCAEFSRARRFGHPEQNTTDNAEERLEESDDMAINNI